ncbi:endonuclease V [Enterococcus sp. LJL128]|uniref:endonuclease V n=1 Tax=Enterococcus sp. LJL51 TaxID=3416656 RepID=UPI003CEA2B3B
MSQEEQFKQEQEKWQPGISLQNTFQLENLKLVAGVDLAYWEHEGKEYGVCCIVLIDYHTKEVVETVDHFSRIEVPYISGYLAFRELPLILEAVKKLTKKPDLYMFDGNGYLHYRHMGIATHASFYLNTPCIGVAKTYLKIAGTDFTMPANEVGAKTKILINSEEYGAAVRSRKDVKPIFVSCGNWIDLTTACKITMHFIEKNSRLPLPTRYADLETHIKRRKYQQSL